MKTLKLLLILTAICFNCCRAQAEITAEMLGCRVAILGPNVVWGASHVVGSATAAVVFQDGQPYIPPGSPSWVRYNDVSGTLKEEHASVFSLMRSFNQPDNDYFLGNPYRSFPPEAITKIAAVKVGDTVLIRSRNRGETVSATVIEVAKDTIGTDFIASPGDGVRTGDSGSLVTTTNNVFVGLIRSQRVGGSTAIIPPLSSLVGTTPVAPLPPPPPVAGTNTAPAPVLFSQSQLDSAIASAKAAERDRLVTQFQELIKQVK